MPYSKIHPDDMILRDHLAYDRTVPANERTFLSYCRTSITLLIAGGTLIKLLHEEVVMMSLGLVAAGMGCLVFFSVFSGTGKQKGGSPWPMKRLWKNRPVE